MARRNGVFASRGESRGGSVPSWVYRAVAYESDDTFRQPVWMCSHVHTNAQDAEICGADWLKNQTAVQDTQE